MSQLNADHLSAPADQVDHFSASTLDIFLNKANDAFFNGLQVPLFADHDALSVASGLSNHAGLSQAFNISSPDRPSFSPSLNSFTGPDLAPSPLFSDTNVFPIFESDNMAMTTDYVDQNTLQTTSLPAPRHTRLPSLVVSPVVQVGDGENTTSDTGSVFSPGRTMGAPTVANRQFLSPNYLEESEYLTDDPDFLSRGALSPPIGHVARNTDGSWMAGPSSRARGLSPVDRDAIHFLSVPTLDEQAKMRDWETKKTTVEKWLTSSTPASDAGDPNEPEARPRRRFIGRRRAKSTNDTPSSNIPLFVNSPQATTNVPGPGVIIDVPSGDEDDENSSGLSGAASSDRLHDGSILGLDADIGHLGSPTADIDWLQTHSQISKREPDSIDPLAITQTRSLGPWADPVVDPYPSTERYHPETANAAIMRFQRRAHDIEAASLAATIGSRRLSDSDFNTSAGVFAPFLWKHREKGERGEKGGNFFGSILAKRGNLSGSSLLKRKNSHSSSNGPSQNQSCSTSPFMPKEDEKVSTTRRLSNWARSKSPRPFTRDNEGGACGEDQHHSSSGNTLSVWKQQAKSVIATRRHRSKSELVKPTQSSVRLRAELAAPTSEHPPFLSELSGGIRRTLNTLTRPRTPAGRGEESSEEKPAIDCQDPIVMELAVRDEPVEPTVPGFRVQIRQLNPRLPDELIERFAQEQVRRYNRLAQLKIDHLKAVRNGKCPSGKFCFALGGQAQPLTPRIGPKDGDTPFVGFQIPLPGMSAGDLEGANADASLVLAQFPSGVPLPPTTRLPARFECPICFEVRSFFKPSDWTKHVLEDVQPFTCTFPNCTEPKSFKRKADWVRHENERHRQRENWTCDLPDCIHTCFRKENFAQHLIREHKMQETKGRGRDNRRGPDDGSDLWAIVDRCRHEDVSKSPSEEPCRFCGNICNSWKKLMVHLGKHMEQISMPVIPATDRAGLTADTVLPPIVHVGGVSTPTTTTVGRPKAHSAASATSRPMARVQRSPMMTDIVTMAGPASMPLGSTSLAEKGTLSNTIGASGAQIQAVVQGMGQAGLAGSGGNLAINDNLQSIFGSGQMFAEPEQTGPTAVDYFSQALFSTGPVESPMQMQLGLMTNHQLDAAGLIMHSYPPPAVSRPSGLADTLAPPLNVPASVNSDCISISGSAMASPMISALAPEQSQSQQFNFHAGVGQTYPGTTMMASSRPRSRTHCQGMLPTSTAQFLGLENGLGADLATASLGQPDMLAMTSLLSTTSLTQTSHGPCLPNGFNNLGLTQQQQQEANMMSLSTLNPNTLAFPTLADSTAPSFAFDDSFVN